MTLAYEMSMFARELAKEGIRRDHPEWSEAQIARELLRLAFLPAPLPPGLSATGLRDTGAAGFCAQRYSRSETSRNAR